MLPLLLVGFASGCSPDTCRDTGTCTDSTEHSDASTDSPSEASVSDASTDPCVNTPNDPKCISEDTAFFVSLSKGDDVAGVGSRDKPFKSVGVVLGKLTTTKKRIYVCEGTYPEDVVLNATHAGVSIFGGVACDWTPAQVQPLFGKTTTALRVDGAGGVAIADVAFKAIDATAAGGSSIAAFVFSSEVTLKHVGLTAGSAGPKALNGAAGNFDLAKYTPAFLHGIVGDSPTLGAALTITCPGTKNNVSVGGAGGKVNGTTGTPGPDNKGTGVGCGSGTNGGNGANGDNAVPALAGTVGGDLLPTGWMPASGIDAEAGGVGQGGGGGGGIGGGYGGGGGGGACGGAGGSGGQGGGGSIALAILQSTVHVANSTLVAATAGEGGDGAGGQLGLTQGGVGGNGDGVTGSCKGGNGGTGGNGAAGSGGAGGVSVGVLYKGTPPDLDGATTTAIVTGTKGIPGKGPGTVGFDGQKVATLKVD